MPNRPSPVGQTFKHFWDFYEQYPEAALESLLRVLCAQSGGRVDIAINELGIVTDEGFTPTLGLVVASDRNAAVEVVSVAPVESVAVDMVEDELVPGDDKDESESAPGGSAAATGPQEEKGTATVDTRS